MKKRINILITILALLTGIVACNDDPEKVEQGIPGNIILENDNICRREVVVIYGNNLGTMADSFQLFIDDVLLPSDSIRVWNNARIEFMPVQTPGKHSVYAVIDTFKTSELVFNLKDIRDIEMVEIPAGTFTMGSVYGLPTEKPEHEVTLTRPFLMSKFEVLQSVYLDVMGNIDSCEIKENFPVNNLSFSDAVGFCNELSRRNGLKTCYVVAGNSITFDTAANGFRLPTEAEWEYAARAGSGSANEYSGGTQSQVCWCSVNSGMQIHEPGRLLPNSWGIYDMSGNLWEWCFDYFSDDYYNVSPKFDPLNLNVGNDSLRVVRGGAFNSGITSCRVSARVQPDDKITYTGIRLVKNK